MKNVIFGFLFIVCYVLASIPLVNKCGGRGWYFIAAAVLCIVASVIFLDAIGSIISDMIKFIKGEEIDDFV